MTTYDLTYFIATPREEWTLEQIADAAEAVSNALNSIIVASYDRPEIKDAERRFGKAQTELAILARELRA